MIILWQIQFNTNYEANQSISKFLILAPAIPGYNISILYVVHPLESVNCEFLILQLSHGSEINCPPYVKDPSRKLRLWCRPDFFKINKTCVLCVSVTHLAKLVIVKPDDLCSGPPAPAMSAGIFTSFLLMASLLTPPPPLFGVGKKVKWEHSVCKLCSHSGTSHQLPAFRICTVSCQLWYGANFALLLCCLSPGKWVLRALLWSCLCRL